jgi:sensor domain CHASE-containing protein
MEIVQAPEGDTRFWGLVVIVSDLDALTERLGDVLKGIRPAVQPGRRIAPLRSKAGLGSAVAFMDPS